MADLSFYRKLRLTEVYYSYYPARLANQSQEASKIFSLSFLEFFLRR